MLEGHSIPLPGLAFTKPAGANGQEAKTYAVVAAWIDDSGKDPVTTHLLAVDMLGHTLKWWPLTDDLQVGFLQVVQERSALVAPPRPN